MGASSVSRFVGFVITADCSVARYKTLRFMTEILSAPSSADILLCSPILESSSRCHGLLMDLQTQNHSRKLYATVLVRDSVP